MKLNLTLPLPTSINKLYINQHGWNPKTKQRFPTGKRILSAEGKKVKEKIQQQAKNQLNHQDWDYDFTEQGFIYMDTNIYFNRKGRDDNNIFKLLCDALEKIVYENDSRVLIRTQKILYDKMNPHVEVSFTPVEYVGVFENESAANEFERRCKSCKRYNRNCSLLRQAKEGFIQEEIHNDSNKWMCDKYKMKK